MAKKTAIETTEEEIIETPVVETEKKEEVTNGLKPEYQGAPSRDFRSVKKEA
jgi:hypothetical protein